MNQNDKNKLEKFSMTHNQIRELKSFLVERYVDNMSTKDLVAYVTDDLDRYYEDMSDAEFIDEAKNYTPKNNRTILIDENDNRVVCHDYRKLTVASKM